MESKVRNETDSSTMQTSCYFYFELVLEGINVHM